MHLCDSSTQVLCHGWIFSSDVYLFISHFPSWNSKEGLFLCPLSLPFLSHYFIFCSSSFWEGISNDKLIAISVLYNKHFAFLLQWGFLILTLHFLILPLHFLVLIHLAHFHKLYPLIVKIVLCLIEDNSCFLNLLFWFHSEKWCASFFQFSGSYVALF